MIPALIALGFLLIIFIVIYNSLIAKKNQVQNAFSAIDAMLKKRFDLLPNLVEFVKQYMQHESMLLTQLTSLRTHANRPDVAAGEKNAMDADLSNGVGSLMLNAENYPDLKANTNFINLQTTWTESEEQIAAARRAYNAAVTNYNDAIMMFPGNLFARAMNYQPFDVLNIHEEERQNVLAKDLFRN